MSDTKLILWSEWTDTSNHRYQILGSEHRRVYSKSKLINMLRARGSDHELILKIFKRSNDNPICWYLPTGEYLLLSIDDILAFEE